MHWAVRHRADQKLSWPGVVLNLAVRPSAGAAHVHAAGAVNGKSTADAPASKAEVVPAKEWIEAWRKRTGAK